MTTYYEAMIGKNIKRLRTEKGFSQQQISYASQISNTTLSGYENGKKTPGLMSLVCIAEAMGVSLDELVFGTKADKIVNSGKDEAEIIVRCIYELWKRNMINPINDTMCGCAMYGQRPENELRGVWQFNYAPVIDRLLQQLNDHKLNEGTYSAPKKHIDLILESSMSEIQNQLSK